MTQYIEPTLAPETFQQMLDIGKIQFACIAGHCWSNSSLPYGQQCTHQNECFTRYCDTRLLNDCDWSAWTFESYQQIEKNKDGDIEEWSPESSETSED